MRYDLGMFQYMHDPTPELIIETFPTLNDKFGSWWEWEPETIEGLLPGHTEHRKGLIQACASLVAQAKSPYAQHTHWREPDIFGALCVEFYGVPASIQYFERPTVSQILYCKHVMDIVDNSIPLEDDVEEYISLCATEGGILYVPGMLGVNKKISSRLKGREGFSDELLYQIEETLMSEDKKKKQLEHIDENSPLNMQILRIVSSFELFKQRTRLASRQIQSMKIDA